MISVDKHNILIIHKINMNISYDFGTCQRIGEKKECQVGDNDGARKEGIGHDLMPIGHLNVFWASFDER